MKRCTCGKKKYLTEDAALHAALGNACHFGRPTRVYACRLGPWWHLTTSPRKEPRKVKQP